MTRDPRIDPQPGDILRQGGMEVLIVEVREGAVYFSRAVAPDSFPLLGYRMSLDNFRQCAAGAEVGG